MVLSSGKHKSMICIELKNPDLGYGEYKWDLAKKNVRSDI